LVERQIARLASGSPRPAGGNGRGMDRPRAGQEAERSVVPPLNTKTAKFQRLIHLLQESGPGLSIRHMAATLGVDERTVKRYLSDLRRLKFDLVQESDSRGRKTLYRIQGAGGPPVHLLAALRKIKAELHAGGNPKHSSHIAQVIRYLEEGAGAAQGALQAASQPGGAEVYHIDHGPFAEADPNPGILKILESAVAARTAIKVTYSGYARESGEFLFFPYTLCLRVGTLYLIGREGANSGPFKSLSVRRIRRAIATRDTFEPDAFNPAEYYKYTFGQWHRQLNEEPETVQLALRAPWLEKYLSESRFNPPGRIVKRSGETCFELKIVIKPDFVNWILSLAPDLAPLKPDSLRKEVTERLRKALEASGGG
jgi:predicted DNA-binding transcriptional regulator YafY